MGRAAVVGVIATLLFAGAPAASRAADAPAFPPGVGSASATGIQVGPSYAKVPLTESLGISFAAHQNNVATAQAQYADLGPIGGALIGESCSNNGEAGKPGTFKASDFPSYAQVDSRDANAAQGETIEAANTITEFARATNQPKGEAVTTIAPFAMSGLLKFGTMVISATSQVTDGKTREARGIVDVSGLSLDSGLFELSNLRWEAVASMGAVNTSSGTFTIGRLNVAGIPVPGATAQTAMDLANSIAGTLGIQLTLPKSRITGGIQYIDPLAITVVPNASRDSVSVAILNAFQPIRQAVVDQLVAADCSYGTDVTVLDGIIGSLTGAGSFTIAVGGAHATTNTIAANKFLQPDVAGAGVTGSASGASGNDIVPTGVLPGFTGDNGTGAAPTQELVTAPPPSGKAQEAAARRHSSTGQRGGALLAVALIALAFFALTAEADRRKIRKVQREILGE